MVNKFFYLGINTILIFWEILIFDKLYKICKICKKNRFKITYFITLFLYIYSLIRWLKRESDFNNLR